MKSRIALILAIVMLVGTLFSVLSFAEGETAPEVTPAAESYTDVKIAYANVNYSDKMYMMFAVPAYTDLPEGAKVELIVWDEVDACSFAYKDTVASATTVAVAELVEAAEEKTSIGGKEHLVFTYDALTAEKMTDVIYARPVITLADGKRVYGDVINYSIVEYVVAAKGGFEGIAALEDQDHVAVLDSMLDFGALAQDYLGDGEAYLPGGFYANDDLAKLWIIPVFDGVEGEPVFGGFFKAGEETYATLNTLNYDYYNAAGWLGADGTAITDEDEDEDNGLQIAVNSTEDVSVKLLFKRKSIINTDVNSQGEAYFSSPEITKNATQYGIGEFSFNPSYSYTGMPGAVEAYQKKNGYHAFGIIDDPYNPGEKTYRWTASHMSALYFDPVKGTYAGLGSDIAGFADTIGTSITFEVEIGRNENGELIGTGNFRIRADSPNPNTGSSAQVNMTVFSVRANGEVVMAANNAVDTKNGIVIGTVPETGYGRFAITVDFSDGSMKAYAKGDDGEMTLVGESVICHADFDLYKNAGVEGYTSLLDWVKVAQKKIEWFGAANELTADEAAELADLDGDGVGETPIIDADGVTNVEALAQITEKHNSLLIKSMKIVAGELYE